MEAVDEVDGVHEVYVNNAAAPFVEVELLDAFECEAGGEGPVGDEEDDD